MRILLLVTLLLLALGAATVFAVWPVVGDAPWLENEKSATPSPTPFPVARYTQQDVVGLVRVALQRELPSCGEEVPHQAWAAVWEGRARSWLVETYCSEEAMPLVSVVLPGWGFFQWRVYEDDGRVIPLTELAAKMMRPKPPSGPSISPNGRRLPVR